MSPSALPLRVDRGGPSWPAALDAIEAPPERLWLRGREELLRAERRVAIVGTRAPTAYGEAQALRFAGALADAGVLVVSGLARGIDSAAHLGALEAGGGTFAVLGSGVDRPWPAGELAERIAREGLLVSEFPPGQAPRPHHFPQRNRLISALSDGVLVVEAAAASGSLITARWAADQGRSVFALPGRVDHPMSRGAHRLLREGATLVESPDELLAELYEDRPPRTAGLRPAHEPRVGTDLLAALAGETAGADELATRLDRPVEAVLAELVGLELAGQVVRGAGGLYRLAVRGH